MMRRLIAGALLVAATAISGDASPTADPSYLFYVASESDDQVSLLRFTPGEGLAVEKVITVGRLPAEIEAPHGLFMGPEGAHWYLTLGHGFPFGSLLKYETGSDSLVAGTELGLFPATVSVSPVGGLAFAVNSNFHGDLEPSTVSIVDLATMMEIDQLETCVMPHGSRFNAAGTKHYSACMMDDRLVEVDVATLAVSRELDVSPGEPGRVCSPTWVAPTTDGRFAYVACNRSDELVEVDLGTWRVTRRFPAPNGPYNVALTGNDAYVVVTQKGSGAVSVWRRDEGRRVAFIPSTRKVTHGVTISPDDRYAFITVEGIGGDPGTVDVIDLESLRSVATAEVGKQAGGIAFWKTEER